MAVKRQYLSDSESSSSDYSSDFIISDSEDVGGININYDSVDTWNKLYEEFKEAALYKNWKRSKFYQNIKALYLEPFVTGNHGSTDTFDALVAIGPLKNRSVNHERHYLDCTLCLDRKHISHFMNDELPVDKECYDKWVHVERVLAVIEDLLENENTRKRDFDGVEAMLDYCHRDMY